MALGSNDDDGMDDDDDELEGSSGVSGDELFNRCINITLEAQEVRDVMYWWLYHQHRSTVLLPAAVERCIWNSAGTPLFCTFELRPPPPLAPLPLAWSATKRDVPRRTPVSRLLDLETDNLLRSHHSQLRMHIHADGCKPLSPPPPPTWITSGF